MVLGVGYLASRLSLVLVPLVIALFPATLLVPVAVWLKDRGAPEALAAFAAIVLGFTAIAGVVGLMVPLVQDELPGLVASASEGMDELEGFLEDGPLPVQIDGISGLLQRAADQLGGEDDGEGGSDAAFGALASAFEGLAGFVLLLVALFFYLKEGRRLVRGVVAAAPRRLQSRLEVFGARVWDTVGRYFRGQLLVALVDAVFIGLGLALLDVPLAVPLAVLVFFGALFPIVGSVTAGALAVLVALADGGLTTGLLALGLIVLVQQLEGNILQPAILGRIVHLHPLVVLFSLTAGAVLFGILGAFLAVPVAAVIARTVEEERDGTTTVQT
ncbi:MAG: AI-2E family transporter [Actinobacteria bacterium]|nr:AI-2E family transporter [Actinomycetota bacterium]